MTRPKLGKRHTCSNLGLELRMGNHEGATPMMDDQVMPPHPRALTSEARLVAELGEIEYMRRAQAEALDWILANPREFLSLSARRFVSLWLGPMRRYSSGASVFLLTVLSIIGARLSFGRMTVPQRAVVIIPMLTYPLIYYVVAYMPRYRVPIDWILYMLAGAAIAAFLREARRRPAIP